MRLIRCHIDNFGKLHDFSYDFNQGENVICHDNGWGKSTFAAFIRAMFYGLEGKNKRRLNENEYAKYTPWQQGIFGGSLTFEAGGKRYVMTRRFGANEDFELRDESTNLPSDDYSKEIGEELFQVDRASFTRTIYIGQNDCVTGATDDINAKIGNLSDNMNDLGSYEKAVERIQASLNAMSPKRITGSIKKREDEIAAVRRKVADGEVISAGLEKLGSHIKKEQEKLGKLEDERESLSGLSQRAAATRVTLAKKEELEKLKAARDTKQREMEDLRGTFPGSVPGIQETDEKIKECVAMEKAAARMAQSAMTREEEEKLSILEKAFRDGMPGENETLQMLEKVRMLEKNRKDLTGKQSALAALEAAGVSGAGDLKKSRVYAATGSMAALVCCLLAIVLLFSRGNQAGAGLSGVSGIFPIAAGLVFGLIFVLNVKGIISGRRAKIKKHNDAISGLRKETGILQDEIERESREVAAYLNRYDILTRPGKSWENFAEALYMLREKRTIYETLRLRKGEYKKAKKEYDTLHASVGSFLARFGGQSGESAKPDERIRQDAPAAAGEVPDGNPMSEELAETWQRILLEEKERIRALSYAARRLEESVRELDAFIKSNDVSAFEKASPDENLPTLQEISERLRENHNEQEQSLRVMQTYAGQLEVLQEKYEEWEEDKECLKMLRDRQEEERTKYDRLEKTKKYLGQAKEAMTARYAEPLLISFRKYFGMVTGESGTRFHLDANINITADEEGKQRDAEAFSFGYRDLFGFCLRIALADAMYTGERPMLILDDPFANLDDGKMAAARKLISEIAKRYQVIYCTCSKARG